MADHEANVLAVKPRDEHRYGYRLWADRASGLLLRVDVIGERGEVLETAAFSDVSIGVRAQPESVVQAMKKLDGYRIVRPALTPTRLEDEGWAMRPVTPGFRLVSCIRRQMEMPGEAAGDPPTRRRRAPDHLFRRPDLRLGVHRALPRRPPHRADVRQPRRDRDADASARATGG